VKTVKMAFKQILMCSLFALAIATPAPFFSNKVSPLEGSPGYCTIYTNTGESGYKQNFQTYAPDLRKFNIDNAMSSACVTGVWFFYDGVNYNTAQSSSVWWLHGIQYCANVAANFNNLASALRYGGSPKSLDQSSFTLYDGQGFQGNEYYSSENVASFRQMSGKGSSLLTTGPAAWTFYTGENYSGTSVCVKPDTVDTKGSQTLHSRFVPKMNKAYDNNLRSAHQGCTSETVLESEPVGTVFNQTVNGGMGYFPA